MEGAPHNLPPQTTSFVGRQEEIREIDELLADPGCRLLTLVGPGGIGKTRLALEVARGFVGPEMGTLASIVYPDGVYLVNLQPVAVADDIVTTIASAVGLQFYDARDPEAQLIRFLANMQALLLLDNFEHLLPGVNLVQRLLSEAPGVNLLVTSRAALNMTQEWLYQVDGMAHPLDGSPDSLDTYSAVQLFLERARQVRHDFSLEDEGPHVAEICRLVEGMPLGIELAAPWLRRLTSKDIVRELRRSLDILESDLYGLPNRHRSMRAVFDHSWELLSPEERQVLMMLSAFRGGFRREAAEYVAGASLRTLASLVDQSLIRLASNGRYEIHELQRQYAAERLTERPEMEKEAGDRHCAYFADFAQQWQEHLGIDVDWHDVTMSQWEVDIDNVRTAWSWAVQSGRIDDLGKCMELMFRYFFRHAKMAGAEQAFGLALVAIRGAEPNRNRDVALGLTLANLGHIDIRNGRNLQAQERLRESQSLLRRHDARHELALATTKFVKALTMTRIQPEEARRLGLEAVSLLEETEQHALLCVTIDDLGWLALCRGQLDESERWYRQELQLGHRMGLQLSVAQALMSLGSCARRRGDYTEAERFLQDSLAIESVDTTSVITLTLLGYVREATGALEQAETYFREGLVLARATGFGIRIAHSTVALGHFYSGQGQLTRASELYQEALQLGASGWYLEYQLQALTGLGRIAVAKEAHKEARPLFEESLGMCRRIEDRRYAIHNLNGLAQLALAQGELVQARRHLQAALGEGTATGLRPRILETLLIAGELFRQEGDLALAARLATLVLNHPATHYRTKQPAQRLLDQLAAEMPADCYAEACRKGESDDLDRAAEEVAARLANDGRHPPGPLSERELEVLRLAAQGYSNRQIAAELTLALGTVKSHLHHVNQKLGVSSRTQAVAQARELKLL